MLNKIFFKIPGKMQKNYKRIILVIAVLLLVVTALVQYITSYSVFGYNLRASFRYYVGRSVDKAIVDTQNILDSYRTLAIKISMDKDMRQLWLDIAEDKELQEKINDKFDMYYADTQYSDEIYLYDSESRNIYSRGKIAGMPIENNLKIKKVIENRKIGAGFDFIIDVEENTYSNIAYFAYYPIKNTDNAIIIKADFNKFSSIFNNIAISNGGFLWILDETGKVFYGNDDIIDKQLLQNIIKEQSNYKKIKKGGENWLFYGKYEKMTERYFVFGISEQEVVEKLHLQRGTMLMGILIGVLLIAVMSTVMISNTFLKSVEMVKLKTVAKKDGVPKDMKEFATSESILRMAVLSTDIFDIATIYGINNMKLSFDEPIALMMFQIADYDKFSVLYTEENDRENFKYYVIKAICNMLSAHAVSQGIRMEKDRILIFVNDTENNIKNYGIEILNGIMEYSNVEFNVYVAEADEYTQLGGQYKKIEKLTEYMFNYDRQILSTDILDNIEVVEYDKFEGYINRVNNFIMFGEIGNAKEQCAELFDMLQRTDANQSKVAVFELISKMDNTLKIVESKYGFAVANGKLIKMQKIMKMKSLREIYDATTGMLNEVESIFSKRMNGEENILVKQVLDYIEENYERRDLGVESIADILNFSPTYIGRVFQKEYGDSITNVIIKIRLEQVARMLVETNEPVAIIAEKVGFGSSSYLGVQFKKRYRMSPGEYRKQEKSE